MTQFRDIFSTSSLLVRRRIMILCAPLAEKRTVIRPSFLLRQQRRFKRSLVASTVSFDSSAWKLNRENSLLIAAACMLMIPCQLRQLAFQTLLPLSHLHRQLKSLVTSTPLLLSYHDSLLISRPIVLVPLVEVDLRLVSLKL